MCEISEKHVASYKCARVDHPLGHTVSIGSCHVESLKALRPLKDLIIDPLAL